MPTWEILNSPLTLTVLSLLWSTVVASAVGASWQRRGQRQDLRIQHIRDLLRSYHDYIRVLKMADAPAAGRDFDLVHAQLLSLSKMCAVLFRDPEVEASWQYVAQSFATLRDLRLKGKAEDFEDRIREICSWGDRATKAMLGEVL